ncbi:MAG: hypothetical protein AAFY29_05370 [Pseudomonadota bacterium]
MSSRAQLQTRAKNFYSVVYGNADPSVMRRCLINAFFVLMGLYFVGLYVDFIPSSKWSELSWRIALSVGAAITVFVWRSYWTGAAKFRPATSGWRIVLALIVLPLLSVLFFWGALTHGTASLLSLALGQETTLQRELTKEVSRNRRLCDHRLTGEVLKPAFPSHYCIASREYEDLPAVAMYLINGRQSYFGILIDRVYLAERQSE